MSRPSPETKAAAVADYLTTRDPYAAVAARHGVSRSVLHSWVNGGPKKPKSAQDEEIAYLGASDFDPRVWEVRGGILRPLFPERRSA